MLASSIGDLPAVTTIIEAHAHELRPTDMNPVTALRCLMLPFVGSDVQEHLQIPNYASSMWGAKCFDCNGGQNQHFNVVSALVMNY